MNAEIVKISAKPRRWAIQVDGKPARSIYMPSAAHTWDWYSTRAAAEADIPKCLEALEYEARILSQDQTAIVWSDKELKEIEEYAAVLRDNKPTRTLTGERLPRDIAREQHDDDARTIEAWLAWPPVGEYGRFVCAKLRRQREARCVAFELAGLELGRERWKLWHWREGTPSAEHPGYFVILCTAVNRSARASRRTSRGGRRNTAKRVTGSRLKGRRSFNQSGAGRGRE